MMSIGESIRNLRKKAGFTQKQLAEKVGVNEVTIRSYEAEKYNPKMNTLTKLCVALDCKITDLIDEDSKKYYRMFDYTEENEQRQGKGSAKKAPKFSDSNNDIYTDPNLQKLYEAAIVKAVRHEELTEEEEQVIIGIPRQLRQKSDSYEDSYSFASSEEELNKLQKEHSIEPNERQNDKIHEYDAVVEITPEAMERLKEDAEAREILKKYESGEKILESEYKKVIEYHKRMMERFKLLQDWLEWYKSTCEPLNNEGRKKVAEYAETLAETDKYANSEEWFKGRPTKEEIDEALKAYLNDDAPEDVKDKWL